MKNQLKITKKIKVKEEEPIIHEVKTEVIVENKPITFNGKKVLSVSEVEINGKIYKDLTVEDGSTYRI